MTAPTITYTTPTPDTTPGAGGAMPSDYPTARTTPIVVQVTDTGGLGLIVVTVQFIGGAVEIAYMGGSFLGEYVGSSFQVSITNGLELHLIRTDGWPGATTGNPSNKTVQINVTAISSGIGATTTSSDALYQMPPSSSLPPVISIPSAPIPTAADFAAEAVSFLIWQFRS